MESIFNIEHSIYLFSVFFLWGNREFEIKNTITVEPVLGGIILSGHPSKRSRFSPNQQTYDRANSTLGISLLNLQFFLGKQAVRSLNINNSPT